MGVLKGSVFSSTLKGCVSIGNEKSKCVCQSVSGRERVGVNQYLEEKGCVSIVPHGLSASGDGTQVFNGRTTRYHPRTHGSYFHGHPLAGAEQGVILIAGHVEIVYTNTLLPEGVENEVALLWRRGSSIVTRDREIY